jgi:hypothetical protein
MLCKSAAIAHAMDSVLEILRNQAGVVLLVLFGIIVVLATMHIRLALRVKSSDGKWRKLLDGAQGDNLERILHDHLRERVALEDRLDNTIRRVDELEGKMRSAKRHMGIKRYDAFEDVGGSQSFALALFDEEGDGVVLTGLIGRTDCRVYCKTLSGGVSDRNMSQEEVDAIRSAK